MHLERSSKAWGKRVEELETREKIESIQSTTLLRSARTLRKVHETCYHTDSNEKQTDNAGVKNSRAVMDQRIRKLMPMHKELHPRDDID